MHNINVWLTVQNADDVPQIRELLAEAGRLSRAEPGCLRFDVFHSNSETTKFLLCEQWQSQTAWEEHRTREAYTRIYTPQVLPRVTREAHRCDLLQ
jgi:quinol monooxygenase YgiN